MTTPGPVAGVRKHGQDRRATGNPVYRGAGPNPTSGTVDPSGYVDRERRSGLAKAILTPSGESGAGTSQPGVSPDLVGETASRVDRREIIRRLARRMTPPTGG